MIRLTLILALVIFAVLVLVPREEGPTGDAPSQAQPPATPADRAVAADEALRERPDGRMVLVTTTGEELAIDLVVAPPDLSAGETAGDTARPPDPDATAIADATPETATAEARSGATRLRVTGDRVNFRAGPSTGDEILGALELGTEVELIERVADGWAHLRVPATGLTGYMSGDFLEPAN